MACGFRSGALRIFDAGSKALLQESRQHTGPVTQLAFARHGRLLLSLGEGPAERAGTCNPAVTELATSSSICGWEWPSIGRPFQLADTAARWPVPAGEDGCVAAYDAERAYMPTAYLLAGFPLHATCMAASQDGRLLAVAALCMTASAQPPSSSGRSSRPAAARAQPAIVLHNTLTLQPALQVAVAGSSPVVQIQLLPDARTVLAATADGRLRGYSCSGGGLMLDVPRCLPQPALCCVLDPSGTFLVAGAAAGRLTVLGLHALRAVEAPGGGAAGSAQQLGGDSGGTNYEASRGVITTLPRQELAAPTGAAVLGAVFASAGRQLLSVSEGGDICCWAFDGQRGHAPSAAGSEAVDATVAIIAVRPQLAAGDSSLRQAAEPAVPAAVAHTGGRLAARPVFNLAADGTAGAAPAPRCPAAVGEAAAINSSSDAAALEQPAPRPLPAALQPCLRARPPSAPLQRSAEGASQLLAAAAARRQQASASLPATPLGRRAGSKKVPFWERQHQPQEVSLLVSTAGGQRSAQVVCGKRRLVIHSPCKAGPGGGKAGQQRSAAWEDGEVAADAIPPYRPEQQLQLLPPSAAVRHVHGFEAAAGFCWLPRTSGEEEQRERQEPAPGGPLGGPQQRQLLFAAGNVLVAEALAAAEAAQQRRIARLPRRITALALSPDGGLAAAAVEPEEAGGSPADICLVDVEAGEVVAVLSHHSYAVTVSKGGRRLGCDEPACVQRQ